MTALIDQQNQTLSFTVRDRNGVIFEGKVLSVTSLNEKGEFDVLPLHSNFISIIREYVTARLVDGVEKRIPLQVGVLMVRDNGVEVYLGILH
ncbi:MAG: hypothetical protein A2934_01880 [Candidatus Sungbacteria bacterium RIFCSPLOWO2_01_FULL_47_10]|uniref:ATP synthase F1 complex delta/epsilon subunit N-terminal domain-containing protein n=1 Tax=Candidatus Sungbacteria bacterium RIFCSPLOWO2_01_FULL_47_10 TaxID=1802276 RepID=A0A1G2L1L9_9BACT|nr:MAG: hypothetical protein A2934_01880 [Candidatus Sungbacteria bacterium RIFCSPLOWO2_01_FULL_47_10]